MEHLIQKRYLESFRAGRLREHFVRTEPFEHAVLEDLFTREFIELASRAGRQVKLEASPTVGEARYANMGWGPFFEPTVLRAILGPEFSAFMSQLLGRPVVMKRKAIPQYFRYAAGSRGMTIHNDANEANGREIVSLLQLSQGYEEGLGGELMLHGKESAGFPFLKRVAPKANTFIVFVISDESWHSVADMKGAWERELVAFDWYFG